MECGTRTVGDAKGRAGTNHLRNDRNQNASSGAGRVSYMQQASWYIGKLFENGFTRPIKRSIVRSIAAKTGPRSLLNRCYSLLGDEAKSRFHGRYAKIF